MTTPGVPSTNEEAWELAGRWGASRYMSPFEALMWRIEADPRLRSTMTVVYLLDCAPDWDRLLAAHEWATRLIPRIRQRVMEPPLGLGMPTWVTDDEFDLGFHVRRLRLPEPGTLRQLLDLVQGDAMASFDRSRPPWRASLVEGLEDNRTAYVLKLHHSLTDGQGGTQLLGLLHSRTREPSPDKPLPDRPAPEDASPVGVLTEQAAGALRSAPGDAVHAVAGIVGGAARLTRRPIDGLEGAARFGRSLQRILAPPPVTPSPLLSHRSRSWRFDALDVPFAELKAAGKAAGGSVNDAYISALLAAFRRYHEHFERPIDEMPMAMPISLRRGDHPMGGNRFAGARFAAPVAQPAADGAGRAGLRRADHQPRPPGEQRRRPPLSGLHRGGTDRADAAVRASSGLCGDGHPPVLRRDVLHRPEHRPRRRHGPRRLRPLPRGGTRRSAHPRLAGRERAPDLSARAPAHDALSDPRPGGA
jgi:diacylglycerol O-acyltransferase / wax synthase